MKVYIGADHNGFYLRNSLKKYLDKAGYEVVDDGDTKLEPGDDYPVFAAKVVNDVLASEDKDAKGILICGSGQGMCMAANRYKGIRACMGYDRKSVLTSRTDDDANILCLAADELEPDKANLLTETFLNTKFAGATRFVRRITQLDET